MGFKQAAILAPASFFLGEEYLSTLGEPEYAHMPF